MKWTDEEVARGVAAAINAGLHDLDLPLGVVTGIMTATAELLAARGGTMTAEEVDTALVRLQSQGESRSERALREHITAQGARIAALDAELEAERQKWEGASQNEAKAMEHISELEKSLENVRRERDETLRIGKQFEAESRKHFEQSCTNLQRAEKAERERDNNQQSAEVWRKRVEAAAEALADVLPGEVGRLDLLARISDLKRQRDEALALAHGSVMDEADHFLADRSKPSGQVAEDVSAIEALWSGVTPPDDDWRKAGESLTRLAAKAQGYDAAVADNAAFLRAARDAKAAKSWQDADACVSIVLIAPHPGAALLERMQKMEKALNALRSIRTYARSLTDSDATRVIGQDLLATLARHRVPDLLDGH